MKIPKQIEGLTDEEKRKWVVEQIKKKEFELDRLKKLSRYLNRNVNFVAINYERPEMK